MPIDVVILPQGSGQPLAHWQESDQHREGKYEFREDEWRKHVLQRARRALNGNWSPTEVFLCLRGDHLVGRYDEHFIKELLKMARRYCWGENVYLVINWRISIHRRQPIWRESLFKWIETAIKHGVTDIIEEQIAPDPFTDAEGNALSHGAILSQQRHRTLPLVARQGDWRCVLPDSMNQENLPTLLDPFVLYGEWRDGMNLIAVMDHGDSVVQSGLVRRWLNKYRRAPMVVTISGYGTTPSRKLQERCNTETLKLIEARGAFELRTLLLRHNQSYQPYGLSKLTKIETFRVEKVMVNKNNRLFKINQTTNYPSLLLTNSFDPDGNIKEINNCLEASLDAGLITQCLPPHTVYRAHPGLRIGALPNVLKSVAPQPGPPLTAWVFLGHGGGERGLKSGPPDSWRKPEYWLAKFKDYGHSLSLAFFAACRSTETARLFAQAGVGVAIGFEKNVTPEACRLLATEVVRAALYTGGDQQKILAAFHAGCRQLSSNDLSYTKPRAYYAVG